MRGSPQVTANLLGCIVCSSKHFVVPEPEHTITLCAQELSAVIIPALLHVVLTAIQLDDQAHIEADKINDVRANGLLAPELEAQLPIAQTAP